ncbi:MAG: hypothetical protein RMM17_04990 [Acidobacteriota bacterium]|nr:hypothetical protein [Blastocatellia bacterium]MDW8412020.1 hypothetical protein [Acidobacteriota bacterium]
MKENKRKALVQLRRTKQRFAAYISQNYAHKARDCRTCSEQCCNDAEFVNVNITRLEAVAMLLTLLRSPRIGKEKYEQIITRARSCVAKYQLSKYGDTFSRTYACPLFEPKQGCLVHWKAKPAACIQHGCYEDWRDLPDEIEMRRVEAFVARLNRAIYGETQWAPIPVWLTSIVDEFPEELAEAPLYELSIPEAK